MRDFADNVRPGTQLAGGPAQGRPRSRSGKHDMTLICGGDVTPNVHAPDLDAPWAAGAGPSDALPVATIAAWTARTAPRSRFEAMVPLAVRVPPEDWDLLGVLF